MNKIIVDDALTTQLIAASEPCFVYDRSGNVIGCFVPQTNRDSHGRPIMPPFSAEELRHANDEKGGRKLDDILSDLERRE